MSRVRGPAGRWAAATCAAVTLGAAGVGALPVASAAAAAPAWTTYRHDAARSGIDPDSTSPVTPSQAWQTPDLDGEVYAQPLVYGSYVYVATENDTVYALNAATGAVAWSSHLATPEPSSVAPCTNIAPSIGITSTPVIDPATNRIYAVGAVSIAGGVSHELFALDLATGQPIAGFPIAADPPYPAGGAPVNQLQRAGLALDDGRILIGYGGNAGDCSTYWGWLVSAPTNGMTALSSFQADPAYADGAIWAGGNAPLIDAAGNVFVATGNGKGDTSPNPDYGDSVVKLSPLASPLDWWAPPNWQILDATDSDLGSSMPTLLPGNFVFQSGKDGNGYLLNAASLGHVSSALVTATGFCAGESLGGSVYDPADATIYAACTAGLQALSLGPGSPPSLAPKAGFAAPAGATGPPMIAGGLVWATDYSGNLYGLDLTTGATRISFTIPETGSQVNHFASPSAGGGRLFVGSGDQVTAYTIAVPPAPSATATALASSANPVAPGTTLTLTATVSPAPDAGTVTFTEGGAPIPGCAAVGTSVATAGTAVCQVVFRRLGTDTLAASYSGDAFYNPSTSARLSESVTRNAARLSGLRVSSRVVSIAGRRVHGRCVTPTKSNHARPKCRAPLRLRVTYTLTARATVTIALQRRLPGRRAGGSCARPTSQNRAGAACARWVAVPGKVTLAGRAGGNAFTFTGRWGGRLLAPGRYRLTAALAAGGPGVTPLSVTFAIVG